MPAAALIILALAIAIVVVVAPVVVIVTLRTWARSAAEIADRRAQMLRDRNVRG